MSQMLVERGQQADPRGPLARGYVPAGAEEFIRRAIQETGCSRSMAVSALRLIVRSHKPQFAHLRGYLAKFSTTDLSHWINRALSAERAALAALLIGDFAERASVDGAFESEADQQLEADRIRAAFARAYPGARPETATGIQRLDAAISQLRQSSPQAAAAMDAVGALSAATSRRT